MTSKLTITDERIEKIAVWLATESHSLNLEMLTCLRELQERRKADSEPVAWTDEEELRDANSGACGYLFGIGRSANKFADPRRQIMLYRHAQQPVVPDRSIFEKWWESQNGAPLDDWDSLRTTDGYCDDGIDGQFEAWNAAMLQAGNSPVIPEGYVMVPKEPTPEILAVINEAIKSMRGSAATYARVLAAAPQEVKGE